MSKKREEYTSWDGYFLGLAAEASFRSKDPSTQNGACIVDPVSLSVLSLGYNGFPRGCSDDEFPWSREGDSSYDTKYPYVEHAEKNAIFNAARKGIALDGSIMYIHSEKGYYPCHECSRAIIQSGIVKVIMGFSIKENTEIYDWSETLRMFTAANITINILGDNVTSQEDLIHDFNLKIEKMKNIISKLKGEE